MVYKPTYNWGAPSCKIVIEISTLLPSFFELPRSVPASAIPTYSPLCVADEVNHMKDSGRCAHVLIKNGRITGFFVGGNNSSIDLISIIIMGIQ